MFRRLEKPVFFRMCRNCRRDFIANNAIDYMCSQACAQEYDLKVKNCISRFEKHKTEKLMKGKA